MVKKVFIGKVFIVISILCLFPSVSPCTHFDVENLSTSSENNCKKIPSQKNQILACIKFHENPSDENYKNLQSIIEDNIFHIESTIKTRFTPQAFQYQKFQAVKINLQEMLHTKQMTLKRLAEAYYDFAETLDPHDNVASSQRDFPTKKTIKENPLLPVPVLSQKGLTNYSTLIDLITEGYYYAGLPLTSRADYDGQNCGSFNFYRHDLFHGDFKVKDPFLIEKTFIFLKKINKLSKEGIEDEQKRELRNFILFLAIHEEGANNEIFSLVAQKSKIHSEETLTFQEFAEIVLNEGVKYRPTKRHFGRFPPTLRLYQEFLTYAEKKSFLSLPQNMDIREQRERDVIGVEKLMGQVEFLHRLILEEKDSFLKSINELCRDR